MVSFGHVAAFCKNQGSGDEEERNTKEVTNRLCSAPLIKLCLEPFLNFLL